MGGGLKTMLTILLAAAVALATLLFGMRMYARSALYHPSSAVVAPTRPGVSAERIVTEDGETLVAWRAAPRDGAPIILYLDGNGGAPEMWDQRWRAIQERGAGFLAVYYRGYSGSTGSPSEAGLIKDARAGYDWLIAQGHAPDDIVIHGFSLGSAVAVQLAAERPARALIMEAPMTGVDDIARAFVPGGFTGFMRDRFKSREFIARIDMPVLIVHGGADRVIPFEHGQRLFTLARAPKALVRIDGADHTDLPARGLYDHIWAFLDNPPPEAADGQSRAQDPEN